MKPRALLLLGCAVVLGGVVAWRFVPRGGSSSAAAGGGAPKAPAVPAGATQPGLNTATDQVAVFQRAFWRRPDATVRILNAERREWADEKTAVQKWQWFIALETQPAFRRWLLEENPFGLTRTAAEARVPEFSGPPAWFPAPSVLGTLVAYRVPGAGLQVFLDTDSGRLYATDAGAGFAASVR
jgi:hypothetical protein